MPTNVMSRKYAYGSSFFALQEYLHIGAEWHTYAPVNLAINGSYNGL